MWQLSIGQRFEHSDQLPAGDSFGYYWADTGGVRLVQQTGGAGDYVAALRYFTMSPEMTRYVGRTLEREYRGPVRSPAEYVQAVTDHQRAYPDCGRWVKERAVWRCRAGD